MCNKKYCKEIGKRYQLVTKTKTKKEYVRITIQYHKTNNFFQEKNLDNSKRMKRRKKI